MFIVFYYFPLFKYLFFWYRFKLHFCFSYFMCLLYKLKSKSIYPSKFCTDRRSNLLEFYEKQSFYKLVLKDLNNLLYSEEMHLFSVFDQFFPSLIPTNFVKVIGLVHLNVWQLCLYSKNMAWGSYGKFLQLTFFFFVLFQGDSTDVQIICEVVITAHVVCKLKQ